jgi:hypothetical protein
MGGQTPPSWEPSRGLSPADLITVPLPDSFKSSVGKQHLPALAHQQALILLGDLADVIPQQGDPLELAQILPAEHP